MFLNLLNTHLYSIYIYINAVKQLITIKKFFFT